MHDKRKVILLTPFRVVSSLSLSLSLPSMNIALKFEISHIAQGRRAGLAQVARALLALSLLRPERRPAAAAVAIRPSARPPDAQQLSGEPQRERKEG